MKNLLNIKAIGIMLLSISMVYLTSCSSNPDNLKVIPKETNIVAVIDAPSLVNKGDLLNMKDMKSFSFLNDELKNDNKKLSALMEDAMSNPTKMGIHLLTDITVFYIDNGPSEEFTCFSAELSDQEKFQQFITDFIAETGEEADVEHEAIYTYLTLPGGRGVIGWDADKALIVMANYGSRDNLAGQLEQLFNLEETEQITANEKFATFFKKKEDISIWACTDLFSNTPVFEKISKEVEYSLSDNYVSAYLDFGDSEIKLTTEFDANEELTAVYETYNKLDRSFDEEILKILPANSYGLVSLSTNTKGYYDIIKSQNEADINQANTLMETLVGISYEDMIASIGGSFVFSLTDIKVIEVENERYDWETGEVRLVKDQKMVPQMSIALDLNGKEILETLLSKAPPALITKQGDYSVVTGLSNYPAYLAYDDSAVVMTNDEQIAKDFSNASTSTVNLASSPYAKDITEYAAYAYLNLNTDEYPTDFRKKIKEDEEASLVFKVWNQVAKSIEFKQTSGTQSEIIIKVIESDKNSLEQILYTLDENYQELLEL